MDAKATAYEAGLDAMFSCDHRNGSDGPSPCQACARHGLKVGVNSAVAAALEEAAKVADKYASDAGDLKLAHEAAGDYRRALESLTERDAFSSIAAAIRRLK